MITELGDKILELRKDGTSIREITKKLGCSKSTTSKWCASLRNNESIIKENTKSKNEKRIQNRLAKREKEVLRQKRPDNPTWFSDYKARLREASKEFLLIPADKKCQYCGYDTYSGNLVFHHLDPSNKEFSINGSRLTYSLKKLVKEAQKCIVLCANCHGECHVGHINVDSIKPLKYSKIPKSAIIWFNS